VLQLGSKTQTIEGVTVFADHADAYAGECKMK